MKEVGGIENTVLGCGEERCTGEVVGVLEWKLFKGGQCLDPDKSGWDKVRREVSLDKNILAVENGIKVRQGD